MFSPLFTDYPHHVESVRQINRVYSVGVTVSGDRPQRCRRKRVASQIVEFDGGLTAARRYEIDDQGIV
ncbi:hypothetical protein R83H12_02815 [Fibrobacteria bacterium R8-3-H12]